MIRLDPDPTDRYHQPYRCCRRLAAAQWEHATERYTATRPWVIVSVNLTVMRGAATRGEALRNAFIQFPDPTAKHDPGAQPEGEDAAVLDDLR
ncbi:hypothetical protein [Methylobacterium frigidaeris]|nr:hypothetical protein [Methylobacterium frigidaeris]